MPLYLLLLDIQILLPEAEALRAELPNVTWEVIIGTGAEPRF